MRIDLLVPYEEKEKAKKLGARWDTARKTWYIIDPINLAPFARWMTGKKLSKKVANVLKYMK